MDNLPLAINLILVGMTVVFLALIALTVIISLFSKLLSRKNTTSETASELRNAAAVLEIDEDEKTEAAEVSDSNDDLIAVLAAAVNAAINTTEYRLKVVSFRRMPHKSPIWNAVGRSEQIESKL